MQYQKDLNQTRPLEHVSSNTGSSSRKPASQQQSGSSKQKQGHTSAGSGSTAMAGVPPHSPSRSMTASQNSSHSSTSSQRAPPAQPPPPAHQTSGSGHPPAPSPNQQARSAKRKQTSSSSQSKKKAAYSTEVDANLSHNIFDSSQSFSSLFSLQNMSPPPGRNMQSEGPPFLTGNFFGASSRPLSNSNKNAPDLGPPYSMFPPSRTQNGIGINFQHGFGMQAMTGNHGGGPMTPHSVAVTPHMSNFTLGNIFPDVNGGAGDGGLNISPMKFPHHANPILPPPQAGMDPTNALQHPHQGTLYHNRPHHGQPHMLPNTMALNSILGHNHHGFDTRSMGQGINTGVGPPFHGPGHPSSFAMPPLNFSMHEH